MRIVARHSRLLIVSGVPYVALGVAGATAVAGITMLMTGAVLPGVAILALAVLPPVLAQYDRIELDGAARVARVTHRHLWHRSTNEIPFASIRDVALEASAKRYMWRPVFVCEDGRRIAWTSRPSYSRDPQSRAVAAARTIGGWSALPVQGPPRAKQVADSFLYLKLICIAALVAAMVPEALYLWRIAEHPSTRPAPMIPLIALIVSASGWTLSTIRAAAAGVEVPVV